MKKMTTKNFQLQTLLLPLVLLSGHVYGETAVDIALTPEVPAVLLVGEAIQGESIDISWNLTGPSDSKLDLICPELSLLKSANCSEGSVSIFEKSEEEKICKGEVYSRESIGNQLTVRFKTESSTSGGGVSCYAILKKEGRIVDGDATEGNDYRFMVAIMKSQQATGVQCGGTIITQRHILTAAGCLDSFQKEALWVIVGAHNLETEWADLPKRNISEMYKHPGHPGRGGKDDIAVLLLTQDIEFGEEIQPLYLPSLDYETVNYDVTALGWGETAPGDIVSPDLLFVILRTTEMREYNGREMNNDPTRICVYTANKDTCKSDGGGPLVIWNHTLNNFVQVGLITDRRAYQGFVVPRRHTKVRPYIDWIRDTVNQYQDNQGQRLNFLI